MKEKHSGTVKILICTAVFAASVLLCEPVSNALSALAGSMFDWTVPFRLAAMISGLLLLASILRFLFRRWTPQSNRGRTALTLSSSALRYLFGLVGLMWALSILGVNVQALLAGAGVVALIIGFGAESLIADVVTGVFMLFEHEYEVGDIIVVGDFRGTVSQIGIRTTSITDGGGNVQIINNSDIRNLINRSSDNSFAVCDIAIPYHGYLRQAEGILEKLLPQLPGKHPDVFSAVPNYLGVQQMDLAHDAVILRVSAEVPEKNIYSAQRRLNRELLLAFEDAGIPRPVAQVHVNRE